MVKTTQFPENPDVIDQQTPNTKKNRLRKKNSKRGGPEKTLGRIDRSGEGLLHNGWGGGYTRAVWKRGVSQDRAKKGKTRYASTKIQGRQRQDGGILEQRPPTPQAKSKRVTAEERGVGRRPCSGGEKNAGKRDEGRVADTTKIEGHSNNSPAATATFESGV